MKKLFYNGNIIILTDEKCEAVIIENDKIIKLGNYDELKDEAEEYIDLKGRTLMLSFIDAHSHLFSLASSMLQVSLDYAISFKEFNATYIYF